jgi:RNA polymerase sigma factor (sigma-70 family)
LVRERGALERIDRRDQPESGTSVDGSFWSAVRSLPERQRAAIALRYLDDLTVDEVATILQVSTGTIKKLLFVARRKLALELGAEEVLDDINR